MTQAVGSSSVRDTQVVAQQPKVFDIGTEAGLLFLLRAIHRSPIKQVVKNHLRDTLFDFKSGDSKQFAVVKKVLDEAGFAVVMNTEQTATAEAPAVAATAASDSPKKVSLGRARVVPKFVSPAPQPVVPAVSPVVEVKSEVPAAAVAPAPVAPPASAPAAPSPSVPSQMAEVPVPAPAAVDVAPPVVEVTPPTPAPAPAAAPIPVTPVPPSVSPEGASALERIKQIKRSINEKVGNPVTLIDMDNQIGREYMNALLSAMKAINGGRLDDVKGTMERLEKAYVTALALASRGQSAQPVVSAPTPTPASVAPTPVAETPTPIQTPTPAPTPITMQSQPQPVGLDGVTPLRPASMVAEPPVRPTPPGDGLAGNPVKINISTASADAAARAAQSFTNPASPQMGTPLTMPPAEPAVSVPITNRLADMQAALKSDVMAPAALDEVVPMTSAAPVPPSPLSAGLPVGGVAVPEPSDTRLMSVAKEEQLQNLMRQNQIKEAQKNKSFESQDRASMDPIMLPEVTAGLKQLLSEWSLFKGSGFFGTGPSGADHPLYKQIAGLTMAAVIAGRFEGATPSVKQSITDYMNGWRYEEGIVHEHTETFEHYLRRVIKHILDQKGLVRPTN